MAENHVWDGKVPLPQIKNTIINFAEQRGVDMLATEDVCGKKILNQCIYLHFPSSHNENMAILYLHYTL